MTMNYAAIVPLRGGSKSIPGKNTKIFAGHPLCAWVLKAALAVPAINGVWVSTDCENIEKVVRSISGDIRIHRRPIHLGGDAVTTEDVIEEWFNATSLSVDAIIILQATSPQTTPVDITQAIDAFESGDSDSLVSGVRVHRFFWNDDSVPLNYEPKSRPMRQQWRGTFMENGAIYISKPAELINSKSRLHGKITLFEMADFTGAELDEPDDWAKLEHRFQEKGLK